MIASGQPGDQQNEPTLAERRAAERSAARALRRKEKRAALRRAEREHMLAAIEAQSDDDADDDGDGDADAVTLPAKVIARTLETERYRTELEDFDRGSRSRLRPRHVIMALSFLLLVAGPIAGAGWYLWNRAAPQYASELGFLVQSEETSNAAGALSGLVGSLTQNSSSNTDILYKFIQSRALVEKVDARLDLRRMWSKHPDDVVFSYRGGPALEDIYAYWQRQVKITYDQGTLDLRVLAFSAEDAQKIAQVIFEESQAKINEINMVSRADRLVYAEETLARSLDQLKSARQAVNEFRNTYKIIDPRVSVTGQEGVLATLQQQLAEALIQRGILESNARPNDQRMAQAKLRVEVIQKQIEDERRKVSEDAPAGQKDGESAMSEIVGKFEALEVDRQFAETTYTAALAAHERARDEADRQSLYLAAYVRPTLAEIAEYPQRVKILLVLGGFLLMGWTIAVMVYYGLRDRR